MKLHTIIYPIMFTLALLVIILLFPPIKNALLNSSEIDSIGHVFSFFCLAWIFYGAIGVSIPVVAVGLTIYGGLTELGQSYLGFRNGQMSDFVADVIGVVLFVLSWLVYQQIIRLTQHK